MPLEPRLAVLAVLAASGAAFGGYYLWPSGRDLTACPPLHSPVPAEAKKALAAYAGRIHYVVARSSDGGRDEMWSDSLTGRDRQLSYDDQGRIESEFGTVRDGAFIRTTWVIFDARTWISERHHVPFRATVDTASTMAQLNRDKVGGGNAAIVGEDVVDGRTTLHLHEVWHLPKPKLPRAATLPKGVHLSALPRTVTFDTWVDPLTYLTVRTRSSQLGTSSVSDERWLPRTRANVAKTVLIVPHGFRREHPRSGATNVAFSVAAKSKRCA